MLAASRVSILVGSELRLLDLRGMGGGGGGKGMFVVSVWMSEMMRGEYSVLVWSLLGPVDGLRVGVKVLMFGAGPGADVLLIEVSE